MKGEVFSSPIPHIGERRVRVVSSPPPLVSTSQQATKHSSSVGRIDLGQLEERPALSDTLHGEEGERPGNLSLDF